jgi:hypothetical protein
MSVCKKKKMNKYEDIISLNGYEDLFIFNGYEGMHF